MFAADEQSPAPSGPSSHLCPSAARKSTATRRTWIGKTAEPLDRVREHERSTLVSEGHQEPEIHSPAAGVPDPADRHDPRPPVAGVGQSIQIDASVVDRHPTRLDAAAGQVHPGVLVRGKLVGQRDDIVAFAPGQPLGHEADSRRRGVGDRCDLLRRRADQVRRCPPYLIDAFLPLGQAVSPNSAACREPACTVSLAGPEIGAVAAWSRYAKRRAMGICCRKLCQELENSVIFRLRLG